MRLTPKLNDYKNSNAEMAKIFSVRLKKLRQSHCMSLEDVANKLGISRQSLVYYTMGDRLPRIPILVAIADLFNTSTDYLLGLTSERYANLQKRQTKTK